MLIIVRNTDEILSRLPFADTDTWLSAGVHVATQWRYAVTFDRVAPAYVRAGLHDRARVLSTKDFQ